MLTDAEWDAAYDEADREIPADVTGIRRQRRIFERMGYRKVEPGSPEYEANLRAYQEGRRRMTGD